MTDLILKFTGDVSENTFPAYKDQALAFVKKADFPIVTDEDFSDSVNNIKKCKEIEAAITLAKQNSFADMEQINKIFDDLGEVFDTVRTFRLKREKDVKKETDRKREKMITDGLTIVSDFFDKTREQTPMLADVMYISDTPMRAAIKGKRTEESGKKAIDDAVEVVVDNIRSSAALVNANDSTIKNSGYPDLFQDIKQLIGKPTTEVELIVSGRVDKHKLAEIERKEKADAAAKAEADRKAKAEEDKKQEDAKAKDAEDKARTGEASALAYLVSNKPNGERKPEDKTTTPASVATGSTYVPVADPGKSGSIPEHIDIYTISFKLNCTVQRAKEIARGIKKEHGNASLTEG